MENESYLVEYNEKVIGVYDDYSQAETFILGCFQNNFMIKSAKILIFIKNSCYQINSKILYNNEISNETEQTNKLIKIKQLLIKSNNKLVNVNNINNINNLNNDNDNDNNDNNVNFMELGKQKIDLQHKINMLKVQKAKMEESKKVYENDIKLFDLFSKSKLNDTTFIIPELFYEKYIIFEKLTKENNLSWENFVNEYQPENNYNDYFTENSYNEMFIPIDSNSNTTTKIDDNINEEFDIESDSNTESSEN